MRIAAEHAVDQIARPVRGTIVDDDHFQPHARAGKHTADRLFDHCRFVEARNEHRDEMVSADWRRRIARIAPGLAQSQRGKDDRTADSEDDGDAEQRRHQDRKAMQDCEESEVDFGGKMLARGQNRHGLDRRHTDQLRNRDEAVALCAKLIDQRRERGDGLRAVAA